MGHVRPVALDGFFGAQPLNGFVDQVGGQVLLRDIGLPGVYHRAPDDHRKADHTRQRQRDVADVLLAIEIRQQVQEMRQQKQDDNDHQDRQKVSGNGDKTAGGRGIRAFPAHRVQKIKSLSGQYLSFTPEHPVMTR